MHVVAFGLTFFFFFFLLFAIIHLSVILYLDTESTETHTWMQTYTVEHMFTCMHTHGHTHVIFEEEKKKKSRKVKVKQPGKCHHQTQQ